MALAAAGATALVQQMATDGWTAARDRMAAFFTGRGTATAAAVEEELDTARAELAAAQRDEDDQLMADVQAEWRARLRRALAADPAAAAELRTLLDELAPAAPETGQSRTVYNTINGGTAHGPVIQVGFGWIGEQRFGGERGSGGRGGQT
ncbi:MULTISPECIES: hypothetical protein [unclassified Streptomyces]|uniref:hypothetical protein n=1 Tax=unclassified Streptomyces TaxID=2593676 RepID=UPI003865BF9A